MLTYRKTTKMEDENWNNKCSVTLPNTMNCPRRITRVANMQFFCEGHFQLKLAEAKQKQDVISDLNEPSEQITGKSEPTEK